MLLLKKFGLVCVEHAFSFGKLSQGYASGLMSGRPCSLSCECFFFCHSLGCHACAGFNLVIAPKVSGAPNPS